MPARQAPAARQPADTRPRDNRRREQNLELIIPVVVWNTDRRNANDRRDHHRRDEQPQKELGESARIHTDPPAKEFSPNQSRTFPPRLKARSITPTTRR